MIGPIELRRMQTEYARPLAELGIVRGVEGSMATHTRVKAYYASVEAAHEPPELSVKDKLAITTGRTSETIVDLQAQALAGRQLKKERDEAQRTARKLSKELDGLKALAAEVRATKLDLVLEMLGGVRDPDNRLQWTLPSLGPIEMEPRSSRPILR